MQNAWNQFSEWFPISGYQHAGATELEVYPKENPYNQDSYLEIDTQFKGRITTLGYQL